MTWLRIDDRMHGHAKVIAAGNAAIGAWLRMSSWSADHLTNGVVTSAVAKSMGSPKELKKLVEVGMLEDTAGGYVIHDYLKYNPSREQVLAEREKGKKRAEESLKRRHASPEETAKPGRKDPDASDSLHVTRPDPLSHSLSSSQPDPTCQVEVAAPMPREAVVSLTMPITSECQRIAEMCGVQDVTTAWRKFTGVFNGRSLDVSGRWQWFCAKEAKDERTARDRARGMARPDKPPAEAKPATPSPEAIREPAVVSEHLAKLRESLAGAGVPPWDQETEDVA